MLIHSCGYILQSAELGETFQPNAMKLISMSPAAVKAAVTQAQMDAAPSRQECLPPTHLEQVCEGVHIVGAPPAVLRCRDPRKGAAETISRLA